MSKSLWGGISSLGKGRGDFSTEECGRFLVELSC